ncbi:M14 family metallopeptidase [Flavobacterium muglaense]|uniref:M14 family metallopeptidase n=1 Tax=Flavobacterium muglaense TaxID=2764716 RepID=A0A923MWY7_9FLAO|nr:M14 family metallopeptidase [Flavobacterium muglaense]MBC5836673.1 M14 family metallopeptidase [Flavobacterium muglaense]MBC5843061.1 M14 family metallopeptidase [Flavobacterium muglaense]
MRFSNLLLLLLTTTVFAQKDLSYPTVFEQGNGNQSATYQETIAYYELLAQNFPTIQIKKMGLTDSGQPLHIVIFNAEKKFSFETIQQNKAVLLINNGIHAGEPDGIDATIQLYRDLALGKISSPKNTVVVTIPVYNIGGALNRNATSRANQDGPELYGFRGNARNYDLNRDFIKADTRNTASFAGIFQLTNPDVFIDNHVSNGADYQYKLTYIMTQQNKIGSIIGNYLDQEMMPALVASLQKKSLETTPYVNAFSETPDQGFAQFFDSPRYSTGYTSLFNTIGFVVETHMLKKYSERVKATYEFMRSTIDYTDANFKQIKQKRVANQSLYLPGANYTIKWALDTTKITPFTFLGFEAGHKKSEATTADRLYYDRTKPFKKEIPYLKEYQPTKQIKIPKAYIIPQGFWNITALLKNNGIEYQELKKDSTITVESYRIADYKTATSAYEGHYLHRDTQLTTQKREVKFSKGDYVVPTQQEGVKYIIETLEPEGIDSFFNWNFFDTMLQQKEGFSDYVFEDTAALLLKENPKLNEAMRQKMIQDTTFAKNPEAQLDWIYKNSVYYEKAHLQYPIYRVLAP